MSWTISGWFCKSHRIQARTYNGILYVLARIRPDLAQIRSDLGWIQPNPAGYRPNLIGFGPEHITEHYMSWAKSWPKSGRIWPETLNPRP
jgi:hypothetical protein